MDVVVLLEDEGQPAVFQPPWPKVPKCRCEGGSCVFRGSDGCWRCGRHVRGLFRPAVTFADYAPRHWELLMRERPYGTPPKMRLAA